MRALTSKKLGGFTLIELAIVLGVVGVMAAGLWRLMSTSGQQTKDQATAQQQQALITAVQGYLADTNTNGGQNWMKLDLGVNGTANLPLPATNTSVATCQASLAALPAGDPGRFADFCNFLPPGFTSTTSNPYGQTYLIQVLRDASAAGTAPNTYSFMIVTTGAVIPDTDGGRISGLIGNDGGFVYTAPVCTAAAAPKEACGTMGSWAVADITAAGPAGYGYVGASFAGSVASRTFVSALSNSSNSWLARVVMPGDTTFYSDNTMTTNLFMGSNIYMFPDNGVGAAPGTGAGTNNIYLSNGSIIGGGSTTITPQISLGAGETAATYSAADVALINLTAPCSALDAVATVPCPGALQIGHGDVYLSNGQLQAQKLFSASDARLKMNIHPIDDPLGNLMKVDAVAFTFRKGGSQSMGVTAQQLEKTYPQLVSETNGTKYVEYNGLIGPLIGAVQQLKRDNDDLREQLRSQALRQDRLEDELRQKKTAP